MYIYIYTKMISPGRSDKMKITIVHDMTLHDMALYSQRFLSTSQFHIFFFVSDLYISGPPTKVRTRFCTHVHTSARTRGDSIQIMSDTDIQAVFIEIVRSHINGLMTRSMTQQRGRGSPRRLQQQQRLTRKVEGRIIDERDQSEQNCLPSIIGASRLGKRVSYENENRESLL